MLRISREHSQSSKIKILNVEEARFSISIREITFREQELNWLFTKYKRLENNPLYSILWNESTYDMHMFSSRNRLYNYTVALFHIYTITWNNIETDFLHDM